MNPICITEAQKTAYFKQFDRNRRQFLNAYTNRFKNALIKQIEPVLSELEKGISEAMSQVDIIQSEPIRQAYSQLYTQVGSYYASNVFNGLKSHGGFQTKDIDDQFLVFMQSWMETEGVNLVTNVTENTKSQLRSILKDGIEKELSVEEMARTMRESGRIAGITRARVIARTEIIRASNIGSLQGARASNLNLSKEWIATRDGRTRTEHAVVDGTIIPTDKEFNIGGESARYPADYQLSAGQSINCRCTLAYVPAEMAPIGVPKEGELPNVNWTTNKSDNIKTMASIIEEEGYEVVVQPFGRGRSNTVAMASQGKVYLNKSGKFFRDPVNNMKDNYDTKWLSSDNPAGVAYHEIAHLKFKQNDNFFSLNHRDIAERVSRYARTNPKEFVSEVYSGLRTGKQYDEQVMKLYKAYSR
jgi:uncharacterized protein with gpF-like domain